MRISIFPAVKEKLGLVPAVQSGGGTQLRFNNSVPAAFALITPIVS